MALTRYRRALVVLTTAAVVLAYPPANQDTVILGQGSGAPTGVIASGQLNGAYVSFRSYHSNSDTVTIGKFQPATSNNEVAAFTSRRPMAIVTPAAWDTVNDTLNISFAPEITIPVTVWVIKGPFADGVQKALDMHGATTQIWNDQRMGVSFQSFDIRDATAFPQFLDFDCSQRDDLQAAIPPVPGQINIYLVDTVDGSLGNGQACGVGGTLGGVMAAVSSSAPDDLLAHEMGHNFGLTDLFPTSKGFNASNVMYKYSSTRRYFTEGQLFRAQMNPASSLNFLYHTRAGQPTRFCSASANNAQCPPLTKRIWADGSFPGN